MRPTSRPSAAVRKSCIARSWNSWRTGPVTSALDALADELVVEPVVSSGRAPSIPVLDSGEAQWGLVGEFRRAVGLRLALAL